MLASEVGEAVSPAGICLFPFLFFVFLVCEEGSAASSRFLGAGSADTAAGDCGDEEGVRVAIDCED